MKLCLQMLLQDTITPEERQLGKHSQSGHAACFCFHIDCQPPCDLTMKFMLAASRWPPGLLSLAAQHQAAAVVHSHVDSLCEHTG